MESFKDLSTEKKISLNISNIGKIEFVSVDITSHNCIVGINNTGKSTVLKVIYSLISSINQFSRLISSNRTKYSFVYESELTDKGVEQLWELITDRIKGIFNLEEINEDSSIELYLDDRFFLEWNGNDVKCTENILEINNIPQVLYLSSPEILTYSHLIYRGESTDTGYSNNFNYVLPYDLDFIEYMATIAERSKIDLPVNIKEKGVSEILEEGKYYRPSVLGTGVKLLRILETLVKSKNDDIIFLIDEPEVGCHPSMQRRISKILLEKFRYFTITTHSIYMVNSLNEDINYMRTSHFENGIELINVQRSELLSDYTDQLVN